MRRRSALALSLSLAFGSLVSPVWAESVTLRGEVVDLSCYLGRGASGAEHAACADRCIASTRTAGFRAEDGSLYLLLQARDASPPVELVAGLAGVPVEIEGTPVERDGFRALRITSAQQQE